MGGERSIGERGLVSVVPPEYAPKAVKSHEILAFTPLGAVLVVG
jgi:hypothetical protein